MRKSPQSICSKTVTGKCLGGACPSHVGYCRGADNVHRAPEEPSYSMEDALIAAIDQQMAEENALVLPHATA